MSRQKGVKPRLFISWTAHFPILGSFISCFRPTPQRKRQIYLSLGAIELGLHSVFPLSILFIESHNPSGQTPWDCFCHGYGFKIEFIITRNWKKINRVKSLQGTLCICLIAGSSSAWQGNHNQVMLWPIQESKFNSRPCTSRGTWWIFSPSACVLLGNGFAESNIHKFFQVPSSPLTRMWSYQAMTPTFTSPSACAVNHNC